MKRGFILWMVCCCTFVVPLRAGVAKPHSSTNQLRKEVSSFFKNQDLNFLEKNVEIIRVGFLINAKNELVVFDVTGDDSDACDYVKKLLNFKQVNYSPVKHMEKYVVDIRLVRE